MTGDDVIDTGAAYRSAVVSTTVINPWITSCCTPPERRNAHVRFRSSAAVTTALKNV